MRRRWLSLAMAAVIVCGASPALGGLVPFEGKVHAESLWQRPSRISETIDGMLHAVESVPVYNATEDVERASTLAHFLLIMPSEMRDNASVGVHGASGRQVGFNYVGYQRDDELFFAMDWMANERAPMDHIVGGSLAAISNNNRTPDLPILAPGGLALKEIHADAIREHVRPELTARRISGFEQRPTDKDGTEKSEQGDEEGQPDIDARKSVGLHDLIYRSPLGTKIGIAIALRIVAIGLIAFGIRLARKDDQSASFAGWLIMVIGALLLCGIVKLVAGVQQPGA